MRFQLLLSSKFYLWNKNPIKLATDVQTIFVSKKEKVSCSACKTSILKGSYYVSEDEKANGLCFSCSPFVHYTFLASGDAAMTRRSKKYSTLCGAVLEWNQRRKRFERLGQFVEAHAITLAKQECENDEASRLLKNQKAAVKREELDKLYIQDFAKAIRMRYPNCPVNRELEIALHACEKHSGRVGRTANAKLFDETMIDLAVEAHIRHTETNYDHEFGKGKKKREIRQDIKLTVVQVMNRWR